MTLPMVEVYLPKSGGKSWKAIAEPINSTDKIEWFENLDDWKSIKVPVTINQKTKECLVFLCSEKRGWISWNDFS